MKASLYLTLISILSIVHGLNLCSTFQNSCEYLINTNLPEKTGLKSTESVDEQLSIKIEKSDNYYISLDVSTFCY